MWPEKLDAKYTIRTHAMTKAQRDEINRKILEADKLERQLGENVVIKIPMILWWVFWFGIFPLIIWRYWS